MMLALVSFDRVCGAPEAECRMTTQSAAIASNVFAVSISVSPFDTLLVEEEILTTSAERRFPAISNEVRVRVDASKKRLMTVFPRSVGTFLIGRVETSLKDSAVSRICRISSRLRSWIPSRSFRLSTRLDFLHDVNRVFGVDFPQPNLNDFTLFSRDFLPDEIGLDRQFAMASINQCSQLNSTHSPEVA